MQRYARHTAVRQVLALGLAVCGVAPVAARAVDAPGRASVGRAVSGTVAGAAADRWRLDMDVLPGERLELDVDDTGGAAPLTVSLLGASAGGAPVPATARATVAAGHRARVRLTYAGAAGRPLIRVAGDGDAAARYVVRIVKLIPVTAATHGDRDMVRPLVTPSPTSPRLYGDHGDFTFSVGGPMVVTHRLRYAGHDLALLTVRCPARRVWVARLPFDARARATMRRLLGDGRSETLTWTLTATDGWGNTARQAVEVHA